MAFIFRQDKVANEMYEAAARARKPGERKYLGMSEIGKPCDRALWYSFRGFDKAPVDGRMIMLFRFGDRIEGEVVHWLTEAGYEIRDRQRSFLVHGGMFAGHWDGEIHGVTQRPHVLEVKSANTKRFKAFKDFGVQKTSPTYYCQAQCYMGYSGLERALFVIQCKDTSELYTERVYFMKSDFEALHERARYIITANAIPEKPFKQDNFECTWCDYRLQCWCPDEAIVTLHVCGTCRYLGFQDLHRFCKNVAHPFEIQQWGIGCDDWEERRDA